MKVVFMQNDPDFDESFLWSEDLGMAKNVFLSLQDRVDSYGDPENLYEYCLPYWTEDHDHIYGILSTIFDKVIVMNSKEAISDNFILDCKEILDGK